MVGVIKGQIISGEYGKLVMRQKSTHNLEIGELLVFEDHELKIILQVYDLVYGSQISQQNLELISGLQLEDDIAPDFMDPQLRNYKLALLKNLVTVKKGKPHVSKRLPEFFSPLREIQPDDLSFLSQHSKPLQLGKLRSGTTILDMDISLPGLDVLSHHVLIAGTTGRGKSNFVSNLLWHATPQEHCGILVLDPHDEYYGRNGKGLSQHPSSSNIAYYTSRDPPPGSRTLCINIQSIKPTHLEGVLDFSDAQKQAINLYYKEFGSEWINAMVTEKELTVGKLFRDDTLGVVKRRLIQLLDIEIVDNKLHSKGIFAWEHGHTTIKDITQELSKGHLVIVDTSSFSGAVELLVGSLVAHEVFASYKRYKMHGQLATKPVVSILLEEAPRVLGKEVLERGPNIFSTIAREGRKFKVGLTAITQLPSLIPRDILANINTKIILGLEMKPERLAIIESAAHDLSDHERAISSLDVGEALITSNFAKFVLPIAIPLFSTPPAKKTTALGVAELE